jgi:hypothetical protein
MAPAPAASTTHEDDDEPINEYEQQRLDRIARNRAVLERLGIPDTIASMQKQLHASKAQRQPRSVRAAKQPTEPTRKSSRQRGVAAGPVTAIIDLPIR